jgi:hypothetical protein
MDQGTGDQLSTTDRTEGRQASADASEVRSSWVRPEEEKTAMPVTEAAAGPPNPAPHAGVLTDARPIAPGVNGDGRTDGVSVVEPQSELEEPVVSDDDESPERDLPQPVTPAEGQLELMAVDSRKQFRARWGDIQTSFVDGPAEAVREADHLVADVMEHLATTFAEERGRLEERWSQGAEDTEHLRVALQRYRQLFRLLLKE